MANVDRMLATARARIGPRVGAEELSLSKQLTDLGRQARAQGAAAMAQTFFQKALRLDPTN